MGNATQAIRYGHPAPLAGRPRLAGRTPGFTLVEVLMATALTVLVIGLLLIPLTGGIGYFRSATARGDAQTVARNALDVMARELAEAAYVQPDMNDNGTVGFAPPLRVDPSDPASQVVTPTRPDWDRMVRYWRALRDPNRDYLPVSRLGETNTYFLARTVVNDPFRTDDPWNLGTQRAAANAANDPTTHWAPVTRVVYADLGYSFDQNGNVTSGARGNTLQPGYPYLAAQWMTRDPGLPNRDQARARYYEDLIKPLTPNASDYDVTGLSFEPMVVSGEWLTPALGREAADKSVYLARNPLWRLGVPFKSWTALQGANDEFISRVVRETWARDPFLLIYRYVPGGNPPYTLFGIGCFDWRSRTMKVLNPDAASSTPILWDTFSYPVRTPSQPLGFDVDWINGSVRFDFPPFDPVANTTVERPLLVIGSYLTERDRAGAKVYDYPLASWWEWRAGDPSANDLRNFLLPDTVSVKLVVNGTPTRAFKRVLRTPQDYSYEFQAGLDPQATGTGETPVYGYIRLPAHLPNGQATNSADTNLWLYYRWRGNGVMPASGVRAWQEQPDLVCAYYRTGAILDVSLTVTRADPAARTAERISQSATVTRRVKLRSTIRGIREIK